MSCLDEIISGERVIIGVKDYKPCVTPESRLYINQLPGMSLKTAAAITPEQYQTGAEFLRECTIMAARHVFNEFSAEISQHFDFRNIVETRDLKIFGLTTNAASNTERGILIKRWRSEAARIFVESVYIKPVADASVTIKVIDGCTETEYAADLVGGCVNEVRLDYKASEEQIKIVFNQATVETYECNHSKGNSGWCTSCGSSGSKHIYVTGWDGSAESSRCYGMGVKVHVQCYEEPILCSLLPKMYYLIWYKSGIEVLKEFLATNRINHIAIFGKERAEALLKEYEEEYKRNYAIFVKSSYNFLRSTKGECVVCNNLRYVQSHP